MKKLSLRPLPLIQALQFGLFVGLVNLILVGVATEVVLFFYIWMTEKRIIYTQNRPEDSIKNLFNFVELSQPALNNESMIIRFHPFFGYVLKPGVFHHELSGLKINNYGFFSPYDYPHVKTNRNQVIIGIFGGSVASDFTVNENIDPSHSRTLIQQLKVLPQFSDKEIIVLNFANGGYKQPQQLLILSYFLSQGQEFDLVINIDGFNEIALSPYNNQAKLDLAMPSFQHFQPLVSLVSGDLSATIKMGDIVKLQQHLNQANQQLNQCKMALCYGVNFLKIQYFSQQYQQKAKALDQYQIQQQAKTNPVQESLISLPKQSEILQEEVMLNQAVNQWLESSQMMYHLLAMRQIPYFHVIQPNQHYPTLRVFSSEEQGIIQESPYRQAAKQGYPILISQGEQMQTSGINLLNAVKIFDQTSETVYRDSCCHYNQLGQDILTQYIAEYVIKTLNLKKTLN